MNWKNIVRITILILFFLSTLWLVVGVPDIFNSPDERANFVFTSQFIETGRLAIHESFNQEVGGVIHPRSVLAFDDQLLPTSFIGLPIVYGLVGKLLGQWSVVYLTPFLAALAIVAWWKTTRRLFDAETLADLSALFLMIHPAFWLYTGRTMMHNVAFVAFLIFAAWFIFARERVTHQRAIGAAIMIVLALFFRSAEVVWVGALTIGAAYYIFKHSSWKMFAVFVGVLVIGAVSILVANKSVFGGYFETGYTLHDPDYTFTFSEPVEDIQNPPDGLLGFVFPFGIHELAILRHVYWYGIWLFPWMTVVSALGMLLVLRRWKKERAPWKMLTVVTLTLAAWLAIVYGSWTFNDNPDPSVVTLGNSYVRYWLPLFVLASPFAARAIFALRSVMQNRRASNALAATLAGIMILLSTRLVFFGHDGFIETRNHLFEFEGKREYILSSTESESIIIVDRADKFLFSDRKVVTPLRSEQTYAAIPALEALAPLYYFGITFPEEDIDYLETVFVPGYQFEFVETIENESLYQIKYTEYED